MPATHCQYLSQYVMSPTTLDLRSHGLGCSFSWAKPSAADEGAGERGKNVLVSREQLLTSSRAVSAVHVEVVVTDAEETLCAPAEVHQAVGALLEHRLAVEAFVVGVTLGLVGGGAGLGLAWVLELSHGWRGHVRSGGGEERGHGEMVVSRVICTWSMVTLSQMLVWSQSNIRLNT